MINYPRNNLINLETHEHHEHFEGKQQKQHEIQLFLSGGVNPNAKVMLGEEGGAWNVTSDTNKMPRIQNPHYT